MAYLTRPKGRYGKTRIVPNLFIPEKCRVRGRLSGRVNTLMIANPGTKLTAANVADAIGSNSATTRNILCSLENRGLLKSEKTNIGSTNVKVRLFYRPRPKK